MFPRRDRESLTDDRGSTITRKTFEQIELEQMSEILDEMREEMHNMQTIMLEGIKTELRGFRSKFETWEDVNKLMEKVKERESEIKVREQMVSESGSLLVLLRTQINDMVRESLEFHLKDLLNKNKDESNRPEIHPPGEEVDGGV